MINNVTDPNEIANDWGGEESEIFEPEIFEDGLDEAERFENWMNDQAERQLDELAND